MNLFTLILTRRNIRKIFRLCIFLLLPLFSYTQTFFDVSSNPADNGSQATGTAAVTPPALMNAGDLVVIYAHYRGTGVTFSLPATGGQSWTLETSPAGAGSQSFAVFWCRFDGSWTTNPSVTIGGGTLGLSAIMYVFRPTSSSNSWGIHIGASNGATTGTAIPITGLTTSVPNTVSMAFWASANDNTWGTLTGAGWSKTGLSNQYRNTAGTDQGHTAAYNIRPTAGNVANVSQTQSSSLSTRTSIISWYELSPPSNDDCAGAISITSATSCVNTAGDLTGSTYNTISPIGCGVADRNDVWYSFTAQSTNPTITLSSAPANPRLQLFSGSCGTLTSLACGNASIAATGLSIGSTYFVRVYTDPNFSGASGSFNICVTDPSPANDLCGGAVVLTSDTVCNNTSGSLYGSTFTATTITAPDCATGVIRDIWYRFVAQTTNPTITLSSLGVNFTNPGMQLLSNNCGGTFTTFFCGTTSIAADFLVPGTTYFIRVYTTTVPAPDSYSGWDFDLCITDVVSPVPANDECATAINLLISANCSNIQGTVAGATASGIAIAPCTGPVAYDVWYKFTAVSASSTITLGSAGTNFNTPRMQLFSGTCGSLSSMACGTTSITNATVTGTTYYVRVYSTTGPAPNGNANFNICVAATGALVRFGNSYVNVTRKTTGGVVQTGDVLEIRMTINHTSGTMTNLRYVDNLPSYTAIAGSAPHDSIKIITNEGLRYKKYTLAAGDDAGTFQATPPAGQYNIRLNLGFGTTVPGAPPDNTSTEFASATGSMIAGTDRPRGGGGMLFAIAYRVVVTGVPGDTIQLNPGQFIYRNGGGDITLSATPFKIVISEPLDLCPNSIGVNIAGEYGGTFGTGTTPNRTADLNLPIAGYSFIANVNATNTIGDGRYGIVKNLSPRNRTLTNARRQPNCTVAPILNINDPMNCNNRMFGHWYIDGDHSGTNNAAGNTPPAADVNGGYMLVVNADYVASEIFRQNFTNLCPNTYYEFSSWIKNICATCGADSIGAQFTGTPTAPASGYPGVYPNLSFLLNDVDYYNTGEIDTLGWLKKGFVFKTGPSQTSAVFSIRNNSQGGGGNDWALDDIAVATCLPTMSYSPTISPNVCEGNAIEIADTISSYFNNYTTFKWQRSTTNGSSWTDLTGVTTLPDTNYYITKYTVPPANTTLADSGDLYRVVVATTAANLTDPNCNISDGVTITLNVNNCNPILDIKLISFNGKLADTKGNLSWSTSGEDSPITFIIEKSPDGINFSAVGELSSFNNQNIINHFSFVDPNPVNEKAWYRIILKTIDGKKKHSSIIHLKNSLPDFELSNFINPFSDKLSFSLTMLGNSLITYELLDVSGKSVLSGKQIVYSGTNSINLENTQALHSGIYILKVYNKDRIITIRVVKRN